MDLLMQVVDDRKITENASRLLNLARYINLNKVQTDTFEGFDTAKTFYHGLINIRNVYCLVWLSEAAFKVTKGCKDLWLFGDGNQKMLPQTENVKYLVNHRFDETGELFVLHVARPPYRPIVLGWFLCQKRETEHRFAIFKYIRRKYEQISKEPTEFQYFVSDFDEASRNAIVQVYVHIRIVMCSWHFERAVDGFGTKDGKTKQNSLVQLQLRRLAKNLCHLPDVFFNVGLQVIRNHGVGGNEDHFAQRLVDYMRRQWKSVGISVYGCIYITNNTSEGRFNSGSFVYRTNAANILEYCNFLQRWERSCVREIYRWTPHKVTRYQHLVAHCTHRFERDINKGNIYEVVEQFLVNLAHRRVSTMERIRKHIGGTPVMHDFLATISLTDISNVTTTTTTTTSIRLAPSVPSIVKNRSSPTSQGTFKINETLISVGHMANINCEFQWRPHQILVRDLDSVFGTLVNGSQLLPTVLCLNNKLTKYCSDWTVIRNNDVVTIGQTNYKLAISYKTVPASRQYFLCTLPAAAPPEHNMELVPMISDECGVGQKRYITIPTFTSIEDVDEDQLVFVGRETKHSQSQNTNAIFKCFSIDRIHGCFMAIDERVLYHQISQTCGTILDGKRVEAATMVVLLNNNSFTYVKLLLTIQRLSALLTS